MGTHSGSARVVVGVDFGTSFSGFAYAKTDKAFEVLEVYEWPNASRASARPYCKTKTSLFYAPSFNSEGGGPFQLVDWGWSALISYTEALNSFAKSDAASSPTELTRPRVPEQGELAFLRHELFNVSLSALGSRGIGECYRHRDMLVLPSGLAQKVGFFAQNFKLGLAANADQNSFLPELPGGLTVEQMVVDYLRCLTGFIMSELQVNYGKHFSIKDVQWCLTVPAIWDERSKQVMRACAEKAGMVQGASSPVSTAGSPFPVDIILEPEAASVYCQYECRKLSLRKGDRLLVADVGGGTVDVVVHEKDDADPGSMRVHEVVRSYGELGGGTFVDDGFFRFVCQKIGCFQKFSRTNKSIVVKIYQWWQGVKADFNGEGYSADFPLPKKLRVAWEKYEQSRRIHRDDDDYYDELRLEGSEIKAIFDTEVEKVIKLISEQVRGIRVLMVVGGFAASPYLRDRIKQAFEGRVEKIMIPENPGSAICRGAVRMHLSKDAAIQSRIAKRTYGIVTARPAEADDPADLRHKDDDGHWSCIKCFSAFVRTGERVPLNASITRSHFPGRHQQRAFSVKLVSSPSKWPKYLRDEDVVLEGTFKVDISEDMHLGKRRCVRITMVFGASLIEVSAERANFGRLGKEKGLSVAFLQE